MSDLITSNSNPRIKNIRKLLDRKHREKQQLFLVEGVRIVGEAIAENWPIEEAIISPELVGDGYARNIVSQFYEKKVNTIMVDRTVFASISKKDGPKGLAAVLNQRWFPIDSILKEPGLWIALDRVQDPGNLGTIMRTADAVGAKGIILVDDCTDPYDPGSIRSSMGAIFTMRLIKSSTVSFQNFVKRSQLFVIGSSDSAAQDYRSAKYEGELILLMGSERQGLSNELQDLCNQLVAIPMVGKSDSLNLAIATSVLLYEIYNRNHPIREGE